MSQERNLDRHKISFHHAFDGIKYTFSTQPNLRIHFTIAFLVIIAGILFQLSAIEWLIIMFTIMWVMVSEMVNTSIESMVNLISKEHTLEAKIAKDVAAGMVLIGAIGSVMVGIVIFIPHIVNLLY